MWIFGPAGEFVSAVEHRDDDSKLMVRARDKKSLEEMVAAIELAGSAGSEIQEVTEDDIYGEAGSDYAWRIVVTKATFAIYLQFMVLNMLDYGNYKSHVGKTRNASWMNSLHGVWNQMYKQDEGTPFSRVYPGSGVGSEAYDAKRGVDYNKVFSHQPYSDYDDFDDAGYGGALSYGSYHSFGPSDDDLQKIEDESPAKEFDYLNGHFEDLGDGTYMWSPDTLEDAHELPAEDTDGEQFFVQMSDGTWKDVQDTHKIIVADKGKETKQK